MSRQVLLLEPNYKNKFPPISLMKLSTYFKLRGDNVVFYKGDLKEFIVNELVDECIQRLNFVDDSINWRLRADKIANYIKYRKQEYLLQIHPEDSEYKKLVIEWIDKYKKKFHNEEWKREPKWDWVGVTTLFTFYWDITIETIEFAKLVVKDTKNLMVGGVLASIQPDELERVTGIKPHVGILGISTENAGPGQHPDIDPDNKYIIDNLPLDYSILDEIDYIYPDHNAYFSYSTRGCIRQCPFCAVPTLEPQYTEYIPLYDRICETRRVFGEQQHLLLMDNNVLASKKLPQIIEDIKSCGFTKDSRFFDSNQYELTIQNLRLHVNDRAYTRKGYKLIEELSTNNNLSEEDRNEIDKLRQSFGLQCFITCTRESIIASYRFFSSYFEKVERKNKHLGRARYVDFNQGVDARLFTEEIVSLLAQIPIRPLRIAFDNIATAPQYLNAIKLSAKYGIKDFSNYLLYNFTDEPIDLYRRLKINVDLCEDLNVSIYSFPMKYHPIKGEHSHDRDYIGPSWNRKYIRAIQAILNATKGKVGRGISFFEKAFGANEDEYKELLIMPETFIVFRLFFEHLGYTQAWRDAYHSLSVEEKDQILPIIYQNDFRNIEEMTNNPRLLHVLGFYKNYRSDIANENSELYKQKIEFDKQLSI